MHTYGNISHFANHKYLAFWARIYCNINDTAYSILVAWVDHLNREPPGLTFLGNSTKPFLVMYSGGGNVSSMIILGFAGNLLQELGIFSISDPPTRRPTRSIAVPDQKPPKNKNEEYGQKFYFLFIQQ